MFWIGMKKLWIWILEPDGSRELMQKCEPFAKGEDGSYLFWDIESQPIEEEFDMHLTDFSGLGVRKVATSIDELFDKMTDKKSIQRGGTLISPRAISCNF
ncbi:hypothetical protein NXY44_00030 [Phocaeicola vulgatus]|uniref:hypothetical protein n=1 Tax=Phocaeicola vulgatus TaxID=821 RepID=UPI002166834C|nr:hypothetical protein [Phocaeicola vulgatus]MCS2858563.1 hypothetical protein [Phocaeicola vulgatus]